MSELAAAVCSVTVTKRRRFFWAAWWTSPPVRRPFRKPDASNGGAATREEALADAEKVAGRTLTLVDAKWARAWSRVLRGQEPWASYDDEGAAARSAPRPEAPAPSPGAPAAADIWSTLGLSPDATIAQIKIAFRKRALETHPDQGGDAVAFAAVRRAYALALERREKAERRPKKKK